MTNTYDFQASLSTRNPALDPNARIVSPRDRTMELLRGIVAKHPGATLGQVIGECRMVPVVAARNEVIRTLHAMGGVWTPGKIAKLLGKDETTIQHALGNRPKQRRAAAAKLAVAS